MIDFKSRVIELTSNKIRLDNEYKELVNILNSTSFSDRARTRLAKRIVKKKQAIEHCENNLQMNIRLSRGVE